MDYAEIAGRVAQAAAAGTPLSIRGANTRAFIGREVAGEPLEVDACRGIVDYDPSELVVSVRCGTPLVDLESMLAEHGQMLPFEAPRFGEESTVGGVVASGLSGPRRAWAGSVRDFVLGTVCVCGRGEVMHFGGRVMKNVAGYDVSRAMVGALGTLGVVVEVSFKVLPAPQAESTRMFEIDEAAAISMLAELGRAPVPLSASCYHDGRLYLRLSGSESGVRAGVSRLGGEPFDDGDTLWRDLRHQRHPFFAGEAETWRLSLPPAATPLDLPGEVLTEWGGALRWLRGPHDLTELNAALAKRGGNATLYRHGDRRGDVYPDPGPVTRRLYQRLKQGFDPAGIFNRGRMYRDL